MNFHMNGMDKSLAELHGVLKTSEESIKETKSCHDGLKGGGEEVLDASQVQRQGNCF
jgi:hypothetical protein